ncbi:MAG: Uma2 family endonuclease [Gammaproteobacteria bacterium]
MKAPLQIAPLQPDAIASRWRQLLDNGHLDELSEGYRLELDQYGELIVSPRPTNHHQLLAGMVCDPLKEALNGFAMAGELRILTPIGVRVPDGFWTPDPLRLFEEPVERAPVICIEVASPGNSAAWLERKAAAFLDAGAQEVIVVSVDGSSARYDRADGVHEESKFVTLRLPLLSAWDRAP